MQAKRAFDFLDSVGVNTHLNYTDKVYGKWLMVKEKILELGAKHVRDVAYTHGVHLSFYRRLSELVQTGIKLNLLTSCKNAYGPESDLTKLYDLYLFTQGGVESFEGPNEPDISGVVDWIGTTKDFQRRLYEAVRDDSRLSGVKVLGPSPVWGQKALGDISAHLDYGNAHPYPGGICPTCKSVYGTSLDGQMSRFKLPSDDKPIAMTETGYHTAVNAPASEGHKPVSETAQGKYIPRLLLEYFNRGFLRTYLYELFDLNPDVTLSRKESNFGLVRNDGTPKPAFTALKNLLALLADTSTLFEPSTLDLHITGALNNVHSCLLQKSNGTFYLVLWLEKSSYDNGQRANQPDDLDARGDIAVPTQKVDLWFQENKTLVAHLFKPDGSVIAHSPKTKKGFFVNIRDALTVLEVS